jgi:hypothetical protein
MPAWKGQVSKQANIDHTRFAGHLRQSDTHDKNQTAGTKLLTGGTKGKLGWASLFGPGRTGLVLSFGAARPVL